MKGSSYLQLSTHLHLGTAIGRKGKGLLRLLLPSDFQQPNTAAEKELKEGAPAITPSLMPRAVWGVMTVLSALARGHSLAFCSSCRTPKQFARSVLTCFQRGTQQFTDNEANRVYIDHITIPPSSNQVSPQCLPAQMPPLGFHQPHWGTQESITAAEHVSPPDQPKETLLTGERCYQERRPELGGGGRREHLCLLPSATVTSLEAERRKG